MTVCQLERAVATATGETLRTVRGLGFHTPAAGRGGPGAEDLVLALGCPFCRRPVPYPGPAAPAECGRCDVEFEFNLAEVYHCGTRAARAAG